VLLVFAALPIEALAFLLGGVGVEEILVSSLILLVNIVFFCTLGIFCSSFTKRTLTATVTSYALILLAVLGLGLIVFVISFSASSNIGNPSSSSLYANMLLIVLWLMSSTNSFSAAIVSEVFLIQNQTLFLVQMPVYMGGGNLYLISPWILHVALYLALTAMMIFVTIQFVKRPDR
jgi:hypothetical protein